MEERQACALLKAKFEAAGFHITEHVSFDEDGVQFEIDGFDVGARVGYEYVTAEAGDGWDVDDSVKAALAARRGSGELYILVVEEAAAPDAAALTKVTEEFLAELENKAPTPSKSPVRKPAPKTSPAKKPARK
jgi:hypothetical protein